MFFFFCNPNMKLFYNKKNFKDFVTIKIVKVFFFLSLLRNLFKDPEINFWRLKVSKKKKNSRELKSLSTKFLSLYQIYIYLYIHRSQSAVVGVKTNRSLRAVSTVLRKC